MTTKQKSMLWKLLASVGSIVLIFTMLGSGYLEMVVKPAIDKRFKPVYWLALENNEIARRQTPVEILEEVRKTIDCMKKADGK